MKRQMLCLLMIGWYGLLSLAAVSPSLHHLVHPESEHSEHSCAVSELADGTLVSQPPAPVQIPLPAVFFRRMEAAASPVSPGSLSFFPTLERGPPFPACSAHL